MFGAVCRFLSSVVAGATQNLCRKILGAIGHKANVIANRCESHSSKPVSGCNVIFRGGCMRSTKVNISKYCNNGCQRNAYATYWSSRTVTPSFLSYSFVYQQCIEFYHLQFVWRECSIQALATTVISGLV